MPDVTVGVSRIGVNGQGGTPIPGQTVQISANGQRDIQQHVIMDGVVATEPRINTMSFTPSIEAVEEFKVQSAVYSAEHGMNSGAQVNVAIKSGTNQFHGTVFEFVRNDKFAARGFFRPPRPAEKQASAKSVWDWPLRADRPRQDVLVIQLGGTPPTPCDAGSRLRTHARYEIGRFLGDHSIGHPMVSAQGKRGRHAGHPAPGISCSPSQQHHPAEPHQPGLAESAHLEGEKPVLRGRIPSFPKLRSAGQRPPIVH